MTHSGESDFHRLRLAFRPQPIFLTSSPSVTPSLPLLQTKHPTGALSVSISFWAHMDLWLNALSSPSPLSRPSSRLVSDASDSKKAPLGVFVGSNLCPLT